MDVFSFLVVASSSFETVDSYAFVSADETAYLDVADGIAEAEDYVAFVLAAYDLASTDAEKSESRKE